MKNNPQITQNLLEEIKKQKTQIIEVDGVKIKTRKNVFPASSNFSKTSQGLCKMFGNLIDKNVLDVGTGTGVQAIHAAKGGAKTVTAIDINPDAIECAKENVLLNNVQDRVSVVKSDLFEKIALGTKFDLIIANLPITDFPSSGVVEASLYDPGYELHRRFLKDAKEYLSHGASIVMTHIDFNGEGDFEKFEELLTSYGYKVDTFEEMSYLGYQWRLYRIVMSVDV